MTSSTIGSSPARRIATISGASGLCAILLLGNGCAPGEDGRAEVARASYAIGLSAGAGFRGVVPIEPEALRQGVVAGLAAGMSTTPVMERREAYARIRDVLKRLAAAELATIAARIDEAQDH